MIRFLDTSALVKRYIEERGSERVGALFRRDRPTVVRIAYAELAAAMARLWRNGRITEEAMHSALRRIDEDFETMSVVEVRREVVRRVPALVMRQPLRGDDAVQLAAALAVQDRGATVDFWTADMRLAEAAQRESLRATLVS